MEDDEERVDRSEARNAGRARAQRVPADVWPLFKHPEDGGSALLEAVNQAEGPGYPGYHRKNARNDSLRGRTRGWDGWLRKKKEKEEEEEGEKRAFLLVANSV